MNADAVTVSDATPLIALAKIGQLSSLTAVFGKVYIPEAVYAEVVTLGSRRPGAEEIRSADWIEVQAVSGRTGVRNLLTWLDLGEAEALALAQELEAAWLLVDESKARAVAQGLGLNIIGTVGLLLVFKQMGLVDAVRPLLDQLRSQRFRLSDTVYQAVLKRAGET